MKIHAMHACNFYSHVFFQIERLFLKRWTDLHNPIHGAAFCLDPEYHDFEHQTGNPEAYADFVKMCDLVHGEGTKASALCLKQYSMYKKRQGLFANQTVMLSSTIMRAGEWWLQNGGGIPELQKVAVRVLSAPVSSGASERVWSTCGLVLSDQRNRLSSARAKKLVSIYMNSRALAKVKKIDYVSETFAWDEHSVQWAENGFTWEENQQKNAEETQCGDDGNALTFVTRVEV